MSRLIVVAGADAAGAALLARRTVDAAADEGRAAVLIDGLRPVDVDVDVDATTVSSLTAALGLAFGELGADPLAPADWVGVPGLSELSVLGAAVRALDDVDAVVVDAGDFTRVRTLVEAPLAVVRLLDSVLTPRLAMQRTAAGDPALFDAFSLARLDALRLTQVLRRPDTTVRLITGIDDSGCARTLATAAALSVLGVTVDGIAATDVPRASDGASKSARRAAEAALARLAVDGIAVWSAGRRCRPAPKGRSPFAGLDALPALDDARLEVVAGEEEFTLDLPLAHAARSDVRVGVQGDRLVVDAVGARRWIDLPSVLRRCLPVHAVRTPTGLRLEFVPDPATWRQAGEVS